VLKDSKGNKEPEIELTEDMVIQLKQVISQGIVKKVRAAKKLIEDDKEVSAGLYIYSLEEFGKMLLLDDSKLENNGYKIKYKNEFLNHGVKFNKALDYLQHHNYNNAIILNDEGGFSATSFSWRSFTIGLLPETEARLSIFYADLIRDKNDNDNIKIMKIPNINEEKFKYAIDEFEVALTEYTS
jgi:hypothetical protein